ncbi:MAG: fumarylacetoacetate hydrolase family protein [Planctomycetota bacterium]|nr:fumarylacetoacetate hydrolase family protein [Planctomycetota bacterium]
MKIARFRDRLGKIKYGIVEGDRIRPAKGDPLSGLTPARSPVAISTVKLLAPIEPVNILALGQNYKAHVEEGGDKLPRAPILFMKATTAVIGPGEPIRIPKVAPAEVDYEAELAVIIGRRARNVQESEALNYVLGYTCANDVSARDCQRGDGQWIRGKSFDTFCPLGPWIETELDPMNCRVQCRIGGRTYQDSSTALMIFKIPYVISYLSAGMTLLPGTVLLTGTPSGVGFAQKPPRFLRPGDTVEVEVEGIGVLRNPVAAGE